MNWPFELPPMPPPAIHGETYESAAFNYWQATDVRAYADACIATALKWAAGQCEQEAAKSVFALTKGIATNCRDRILSALPKESER